MDRITLCYFPFLERADMAFGSCSRGCVANAKFLAHSEAANIARRAVNRVSEKEQFGTPLFGGPYLQHNQQKENSVRSNEVLSRLLGVPFVLNLGHPPRLLSGWLFVWSSRFPRHRDAPFQGFKDIRHGCQRDSR